MIDPIGQLYEILQSFVQEDKSSFNGRLVVHLRQANGVDLKEMLSASSEDLQVMRLRYQRRRLQEIPRLLDSTDKKVYALFEKLQNTQVEERRALAELLDKCVQLGVEDHSIEILQLKMRGVQNLKNLRLCLEKCRRESLDHLDTAAATSQFLYVLKTMSMEDREKFVEVVESFLDRCKDSSQIRKLVEFLKNLKAKELDAVKLILGKCKGDMKVMLDLLFTINMSVQKEQREEILEDLKLDLNKCENGEQIRSILFVIIGTGVEKRRELLKSIRPFLNKCENGEQISRLIFTLRIMETAKLEIVKSFLNNCESWEEMVRVIFALQKVQIEELEIIKPHHDEAFAVFRLGHCNWKKFWGKLKELQNSHHLSAASCLIAGVLTYQGEKYRTVIDLLSEAVLNPRTKKDARSILDKILDSEDEGAVEKIASYLIDGDLPDELPLMQKAIARMTTLGVPGPKNPYTLYKNLKALAETPTRLIPPAQGGLRFNPKAIEAKAQGLALTKADFPPGVTLNAWNLLSKRVKSKMAAHQKQLKEIIGATDRERAPIFATLDSPYLKELLQFGDKISIVQGQFASLFHNVLQLNDEVEAGKILSDREEGLIVLARAIQDCGTGKADVITRAYLYSPFKIQKMEQSNASISSAEEGRMISFVTDFMQRYFTSKLISGTWLLRALIGKNLGEQGSHQILYLKNLIGPAIGLIDGIRFDPHTEVLYDQLLQKTREEALAVFYRTVTPSDVIAELEKAVNIEIFKDKSTIYRDLDLFLGGNMFELSDDSRIAFTADGARHFLEKVDFLCHE